MRSQLVASHREEVKSLAHRSCQKSIARNHRPFVAIGARTVAVKALLDTRLQ